MSEVIGKGVIEVSADATKLTAGIDEAKRSLKGLGVAAGEATKSQGASIDRYIKQLGVAAVTTGKTTRELELYKLALRGATAEQLRVADSALKMTEGYERGIKVGNQLKTGFLALGAAAATGLIAAYVAFNQLVKKAGDFQDMAEKTGDTAENIASLAVAAATAGTSMDSIVGAASKLTKGLTGVDDESKAAGAAIAALGLDLTAFKQLAPADQLETVAKALGGFQDGAQKSAVAMALFGKAGAELMPFLKELGQEGGRQVFLTQEQITLADAYADKQAKQRAELGLTAAAIASRMLPAYTALTGALNDAGKEMLGVGKASTDLSENHGVENFAENAINALAFVADAVNGVVTIFARTGEFLGASGAAIVAKVTGDTAGLKTIQDAYNESLDRGSVSFRALYQNRLAAQKQEAEIARGRGIKADEMGSWDTKPVLKFGGAVKPEKKGKDTSGAEAKAQLTFDVDQIRKDSETLLNSFSNAEKIMEARRAAVLINDRDYYAAKLAFLSINSLAQETALQEELARLGKEQLVGKDKIDNQRKIVDAQAKLDKVRENSAANIEVTKIREVAANAKIAQSYVDASNAAQAYIDTVNKQNAREIAGIGKGEEFRTNQAGRNTIEDKQTTQRQGLEGELRRNEIDRTQFDTYLAIVNDTYAKEVQAYDARTAAMKEKQGDWVNGATDAFANYATWQEIQQPFLQAHSPHWKTALHQAFRNPSCTAKASARAWRASHRPLPMNSSRPASRWRRNGLSRKPASPAPRQSARQRAAPSNQPLPLSRCCCGQARPSRTS